MTDFVVAIPARYSATRLPGKPLRDIGGKPLVVRVAERALLAGAAEVWVAADDERIVDALKGTPVRVALTATTHQSGTDRLAECARIAGWADDRIVVNLQGDEPFAPAEGIRAVARLLEASEAPMSTLCTPITELRELLNPNVVKVVANQRDEALYFSRAPIPFARDAFASGMTELPKGLRALRHIGIYGYRAGFLQTFSAMPPSSYEQMESLEQLRVLEAGYRIAVQVTPAAFPPGVDTPEDLERAIRHLAAGLA